MGQAKSRRSNPWQIGLAALAGRVGTYTASLDSQSPVVERVEVPLLDLPDGLEGLTIVQLSDFHWGLFVGHAQVRRAVDLALSLAGDLIVLTGDFVSRSAHYAPDWAQELRRLRAPLGVYAVLGNHDVWVDADTVARDLEEVGIVMLRDTCVGLRVGGSRLWLLGLEDVGVTCGLLRGFFSSFKARAQRVRGVLNDLLTGLPANEPRVLLVHNPDLVTMLPPKRLDLVLCGHTHGGQIRLPRLGAPLVPLCLGRGYLSGLIRHGSTWVYVNRGIGVGWLPIRLLCPPEVTCLRLIRV